MKKGKIIAAACAILIGWCCTLDGIAEVIYAGENNYNFISKKLVLLMNWIR